MCVFYRGSRRSEVYSFITSFSRSFKKNKRNPSHNRFLFLPVADQVKELVTDALKQWTVPITVVEGENNKYAAMNASRAALAASGNGGPWSLAMG